MNQLGIVYFVGAGVGEHTLTQRGDQILRRAQVIIYDALVAPTLLDRAPESCLKIPVGKRGGQASTPQAQINALLVHHVQQGQTVVRLKSGDPLIFGRTREEVAALRTVPCRWEFVPGLSAALAAPGLVGIPLTDKVLSSGFGVFTGHEVAALDWETLARLETLVFLMAGRTLGAIATQLQQAGKAATCPVAVIQQIGGLAQRVWWGTLADILEHTGGENLSPCVIVIGEVVAVQQELGGPLAGRTILVTRAAEQSSAFTQLLQAQGASVIDLPALVITPPSTWQPLDDAIAQLSQYDWLILTSVNGVQAFFDRLTHHGLDERALGLIKIAVVGQKTAQFLQCYHLQPNFVPPNYVADDLIAAFPEPLSGQKILFPRVESGSRDILVQELTTQGAQMTAVPAYESRCPEDLPAIATAALQSGKVDVITFASSKTVRNVQQLLRQVPGLEPQLPHLCLAAIGPQTAATCRECFGRVDVEAAVYTLEGLTTALIVWAAAQNTPPSPPATSTLTQP